MSLEHLCRKNNIPTRTDQHQKIVLDCFFEPPKTSTEPSTFGQIHRLATFKTSYQCNYGEAWVISNNLPLLRETCCPTFMPGSHSCLASSHWTSWSCSSSMQLPFDCTSPHKFSPPSSSKSMRFSGSISGTYMSMSSMKSGSNSMMPLPYFITATNQGLRFQTKFKIHQGIRTHSFFWKKTAT